MKRQDLANMRVQANAAFANTCRRPKRMPGQESSDERNAPVGVLEQNATVVPINSSGHAPAARSVN